MFVPNTIKNATIMLLKPLALLDGTYTVGHQFLVTGTSNRGLDLQDLESSRRIIEASLQEHVDYKIVPTVRPPTPLPFNR